jgi:hypothetical protein
MSEDWPKRLLAGVNKIIPSNQRGPHKPPTTLFQSATDIAAFIATQLSIAHIAEAVRGGVVEAFLRVALDTADPDRRDKDLNSARELLEFSRHDSQKLEEIIRLHAEKIAGRVGTITPDSKTARLHLAKLEQLDDAERVNALSRSDPAVMDDKDARKKQKEVWNPAVADVLYKFVMGHRDEALTLARNLELVAATVVQSDVAPVPADLKPEAENKPILKASIWVLVISLGAGILQAASTPPSDTKPFEVATLTDFDAMESRDKLAGGQYLFRSPIQDVGPPPVDADSCYDRYHWAHSNGAIDVDATLVHVTITVAKGHSLRIVGAQRKPAEPPKSPTVGHIATCGGKGGPPVRHIYMNLDNGEKAYYDGHDPEPKELDIPIDQAEAGVIDIQSSTLDHDWTYRIELVAVVDGKQQTITIDDNGMPFRTTSQTNARQYRWIDHQWLDITSGEAAKATSGTNTAVNLPDACKVVTQEDAKGVLGGAFTRGMYSPPTAGQLDTGLQISVSNCEHVSQNASVQVSVMEPSDSQKTQELFDYLLKKADARNEAKDLAGYGGKAKIIGGVRVLMAHNNRILDISITRNNGRADPLDVKYVETLLRIGAERM